MVIDTNQTKTTVAYRCPHCGAAVMSAVSLFALRGSMVRLKCTCGRSMMEIQPSTDRQIHLTVPCLICPKPHHFTVSEKIFFGSELFVLPCPSSDLNLCARGEINHVKAELARTELQLLDLMEENGIDSFEALHGEPDENGSMSDPQVLEIILFVIRDLDDEGKIYCKCPPDTKRNFDVEIRPEGVCVTCAQCGAHKIIPVNSFIEANDFLNCDSLTLE